VRVEQECRILPNISIFPDLPTLDGPETAENGHHASDFRPIEIAHHEV
jgi:hypothetical protein